MTPVSLPDMEQSIKQEMGQQNGSAGKVLTTKSDNLRGKEHMFHGIRAHRWREN